jgi:hypothetical protein
LARSMNRNEVAVNTKTAGVWSARKQIERLRYMHRNRSIEDWSRKRASARS